MAKNPEIKKTRYEEYDNGPDDETWYWKFEAQQEYPTAFVEKWSVQWYKKRESNPIAAGEQISTNYICISCFLGVQLSV